jgi:hypothetical protein
MDDPTPQQPKEKTTREWAAHWQEELSAARRNLEQWHESGKKIVRRFKDERDGAEDEKTRWNLFTANTLTVMALLYGQTPKSKVKRAFDDATDDTARVSGEILQRLINADIEREGDTYREALEYALEDRLLPGMGVARVRYEAKFNPGQETPAVLDGATGAEIAPAVPAVPVKTYECCHVDYMHWQDFLWSPCRVWHEVRWVAFGSDMGSAQSSKRFPQHAGRLPLNARPLSDEEKQRGSEHGRTRVWEVWDRDTKRVFWVVEGYPDLLDSKDDPLELSGFFPCPKPMFGATTTTDKLVPRPDFVVAQDLYDEIDLNATKIRLLSKAIRVAGVYDKTNTEIQRLLTEAGFNQLIPVNNWASLAEKGGLRGAVDWFPTEQVANAIATLEARQATLKVQLDEVTGFPDILRGQGQQAATATAERIKGGFASARLQRLQDDFARFASDLLRLKAEVVANLYDDATIIAQSNVEYTADKALAPQAIALLRENLAHYRIQVKPEAIARLDSAVQREEGTETLAALTAFFQGMGGIAAQLPGALPYLLRMLQSIVARLPGGAELEPVLDEAIAAYQQAQQQPGTPPPPDPKVVAQQMKGQQEIAKIEAETNARLVELDAEVDANARQEQNQMVANVTEARIKHSITQAGKPPPKPGGVPQ